MRGAVRGQVAPALAVQRRQAIELRHEAACPASEGEQAGEGGGPDGWVGWCGRRQAGGPARAQEAAPFDLESLPQNETAKKLIDMPRLAPNLTPERRPRPSVTDLSDAPSPVRAAEAAPSDDLWERLERALANARTARQDAKRVAATSFTGIDAAFNPHGQDAKTKARSFLSVAARSSAKLQAAIEELEAQALAAKAYHVRLGVGQYLDPSTSVRLASLCLLLLAHPKVGGSRLCSAGRRCSATPPSSLACCRCRPSLC